MNSIKEEMKLVKEWIREYEYHQSAQQYSVGVVNLEISRGANCVHADIILDDGCGLIERHNECRYPLDKILERLN